MDAPTLREAMVGHLTPGQRRDAELRPERYLALAPGFDAALAQAGCTTLNRAAMLCAQLGHESSGLRYMHEIASGAAYENRRDLGNTQPGDGRRFRGHGPIQITGRANHASVSRWAFDHGFVPTATYFVDHPDELATDRYGFLGAVWYWTVARARINGMCDAGDLLGVTKAINGGTHGLADRRARWNACLRLGNALLPSGVPAPPPQHASTRRVLQLTTPHMKGEDVGELQEVLGSWYPILGLRADQDFGRKTRDGVIHLQTLARLPKKDRDGIAGPHVYRLLRMT